MSSTRAGTFQRAPGISSTSASLADATPRFFNCVTARRNAFTPRRSVRMGWKGRRPSNKPHASRSEMRRRARKTSVRRRKCSTARTQNRSGAHEAALRSRSSTSGNSEATHRAAESSSSLAQAVTEARDRPNRQHHCLVEHRNGSEEIASASSDSGLMRNVGTRQRRRKTLRLP